MKFTFTWFMDKLGYMPKINVEIGNVAKFPIKKKPTVQKATTRKKKVK